MCAERAASITSSREASGVAVGDVVEHGVVEQNRVLRNDAQARPQAGLRHVADVLAVDGDAPAGHVVEAEQQAATASTCPSRCAPTTATVFPAGISKLTSNRIWRRGS